MEYYSAAAEHDDPAVTPRRRQVPRWLAIILACCFAALIPETILTSSTSVLQILISPLSLVYIAVFYGSAMLVLREVMIRKPASWVSVVLLGIAFGFCNEGVVAGTWYRVLNPGYRFLGPVDVAWAVALTVFHVFISMIMTVSFTDVLMPSYAGKSLLGRRGTIITAGIFIVFNALVLLSPIYRGDRALVLAGALALAAIALLLPAVPTQPTGKISATKAAPRLLWLRLSGFLAFFLYFVDIYLIPRVVAGLPHMPSIRAQFIDMAITLAGSALVLWRGISWSSRDGWGPQQNLALISGVVTVSVLVSVLVPGQRAILEPLATVPFFLLLLWRSRQWSRLASGKAV